MQNGDPGCDASNWPGPAGSSNPLSFNPTALNISQWADSMEALGVTGWDWGVQRVKEN